jgi:predicted PurR-regulated permease PerM
MSSPADRYRGIAFGTMTFLVLGLAVFLMMPFLPALLWATVLSILTYPLFRRMANRFSTSRAMREARGETVSALITVVFTLFIICIPFLLIGIGLFVQLGGVTAAIAVDPQHPPGQTTLEAILMQVDATLRPITARLGAGQFSIAEYVAAHREELGQAMRAPAGRIAGQTLFTVLTMVFALITQFFILRDGHRLREPALQLIPLPREQSQLVLDRVWDTVWAVFVGTVLVAIVQGAIIGAAYAFAGVPNALLLGVISMVLCIIPLLGAPVLYVPIGLFLLIEGDLIGAGIVLVVGFGIVSQIDNILKPIFIGGRINLHPLAIFFSILGGVLLIGPIGVMAGPMILTVLLAVQDIIRERLAMAEAESVAETEPAT